MGRPTVRPTETPKPSVSVAGVFVDAARKEVYVADVYLNGRVVKFNKTGGFHESLGWTWRQSRFSYWHLR
jgi:hypothetical protein